MAETKNYDLTVVGGGTSGAFAASTASDLGLDVALIERKSEEETGHIACGDAVHNPLNEHEFPGPIDMEKVAEESGAESNITRGLYLDEELGIEMEIPFDEPGNVIDRYRWGQELIRQAEELGVDVYYDTVVNDVKQSETVDGVRGIRKGNELEFNSDMVIDAAGCRSILQDMVDFKDLGGADFQTHFENSHFTQDGSAYREVIETQEEVDYDDALVVKPTEVGLGYLWYFPRSATEINVGVGFQMSEPPMQMVQAIKNDIEDRPEYQGAKVQERLGRGDKLGSALGLRRPLDSAVAPGYISVGDAAGMVSPTTGKGITGAAISGHKAGELAADAIPDEDVSEENLWEQNHYIFAQHGEGAKLAKQDVFNVAGSGYERDELRGAVSMIPVETLMDGISGNSPDRTRLDEARVLLSMAGKAIDNKREGIYDKLEADLTDSAEVLYDMIKVAGTAEEMKHHYEDYPETREGFETWEQTRNALDQDIRDITGAEPKYD